MMNAGSLDFEKAQAHSKSICYPEKAGKAPNRFYTKPKTKGKITRNQGRLYLAVDEIPKAAHSMKNGVYPAQF